MTLDKAWKILDLTPGDYAGVDKAFRTASKRWHPDKNPGDKIAEERFKQLGAARDLLRAKGAEPEPESMFDSLVKEFHARRSRGGEDLHHVVWVSLEDAAQGCFKTLEFPRMEKCTKCDGAGGQNPEDCIYCNGTGLHRQTDGPISIHTPCIACHGLGKKFKSPCCCNRGRAINVNTLNIPIKPGIADGYTLLRRGGGCDGIEGGPSGDLYIQVRVMQHEIFERDGNDLIQIWPISIVTAALGGKVQVPTLLDGLVSVIVPQGTQPGSVITVPNKGVTKDAHMHVAFRVDVPTSLTDKQKDLLKEFAREG